MWYRIVKGSELGNFMQHPGYGPGDLCYKSGDHYVLEKSSYLIKKGTELVSVDLDDLGKYHINLTLRYSKLSNSPDVLKKVYRMLKFPTPLSAGVHVKWKGRLWVVTKRYKEIVTVANENEKLTLHPYDKIEPLSASEFDDLVDNEKKHYLYHALRHLYTDLYSENEIRAIYSLMTGHRLKTHIHLVDSKGFSKDILQYDQDRIMWPSSSHLSQEPSETFFEKTGEVVDGKVVYREVNNA